MVVNIFKTMEFNEKLQELRKQKGLTQEQLSEILFVSRTAISKWESGRGYPSIDSLKAISKFFSVSIYDLLSGEEILNIAQEDNNKKEKQFRSLIFGLFDCSLSLLFFLPLFGQKVGGVIQEISLLGLTEIQLYLKIAYFIIVVGTIVLGIASLALQNYDCAFWSQNKNKFSLLFSIIGVFIFIISQQPYAAIYTFVFLIIKALMLIKQQ